MTHIIWFIAYESYQLVIWWNFKNFLERRDSKIRYRITSTWIQYSCGWYTFWKLLSLIATRGKHVTFLWHKWQQPSFDILVTRVFFRPEHKVCHMSNKIKTAVWCHPMKFNAPPHSTTDVSIHFYKILKGSYPASKYPWNHKISQNHNNL